MARRSEPPILEVLDNARNATQVRTVLNASLRASVRDAQQAPWEGSFVMLSQPFAERLAKMKGIKHRILLYLCSQVEFAKFAQVREESAYQDERGVWMRRYRVQRSGCRVNLGQQQIADALDCSRQTVNEGIMGLKRAGAILDWGDEWVELDCEFIWLGDLDKKTAYWYHQEKFRVAHRKSTDKNA